MTDPAVDLSLIIPCYNEETIMRESFAEVVKLLNTTVYSYEIILVEDKSRDNTLEIVKDLVKQYDSINIKLICHEKNTGRGKAVTDGIRAASGEVVGFIDIDLEVAIHNIIPLVNKIKEGFQVASGKRAYKSTVNQRGISSKSYSWLVRKLLNVKLMDTETGFKFFNREAILPLLQKTEDPHWFWDTEIMVRSYYEGLRMVEYPVLFIRRPEVPSTLRFFHDCFYSFFKMLQFRKIATEYRRKADERPRIIPPVQQ